MYLHRGTYLLVEILARAAERLEGMGPLYGHARDRVGGLRRKLRQVWTPEAIEWGVITDPSGNPVAALAVSELNPCQIEELEDTIRAVIQGW